MLKIGKYIFVILLLTLVHQQQSKAQPRRYVARTFYWDLVTFQQAAGLGIYGSKDAANWSISYSPRANLIMFGDNTLSFGTHLAAGVSGKGVQGLKLVYDAPIVFDFNFGHKALIDNTQPFGGFFGGGYGFSQLRDESGTYRSNGIVINGGIRGLVAERSLTLRGSYMLGLKKSKPNVYSVGVQYNF